MNGILRKHLAFFLDPGLGKTSIILSIYKILRRFRLTKGVLVVAPLRPAYMVWPKEAKKWTNFHDVSVCVLHNEWLENKEISIKKDYDIYVINPEGLPWLVAYLKDKKKWPFDILVIDESTKFKNMSSSRFKNIKQLIGRFKRRYILTGTPIPNGLLNIQGQMYIVDQGESLGAKQTYFRQEYFRPIGRREWNQWEIRSKENENRIYKKISKYAIRLSAMDHLDLPEKIDNIIKVKLPKKARKHYNELEKELFTIIQGSEIDTPTASSVAQKCWQIANGCLYEDQDILKEKKPSKDRKYFVLHEAKLDALEDLIEELDHKPILVAYNFTHDLKQLKKRFGNKLKALERGITMKESMKIEKDWNAGKIKILAAYPGTAALGLNLQECGSDIAWYSLTHDLEAYDQFIKRIWRQGMKGKVVRNHILLAEGTVDEDIIKSLNRKDKKQTNMLSMVKKYSEKRMGTLTPKKK